MRRLLLPEAARGGDPGRIDRRQSCIVSGRVARRASARIAAHRVCRERIESGRHAAGAIAAGGTTALVAMEEPVFAAAIAVEPAALFPRTVHVAVAAVANPAAAGVVGVTGSVSMPMAALSTGWERPGVLEVLVPVAVGFERRIAVVRAVVE